MSGVVRRAAFGKRTVRVTSLLALLLVGLYAAAQVELEPRVFIIGDKLRCPVCISETVAESASPTSVEMRNLIQEMLNEGKSEADILGFFQARYGDWILLTPPRRGYYLVVWLAPIIGGLAILGTVLVYMQRWTKRSRTPIEVDGSYLAAAQKLALDSEREA